MSSFWPVVGMQHYEQEPSQMYVSSHAQVYKKIRLLQRYHTGNGQVQAQLQKSEDKDWIISRINRRQDLSGL